MSTHYNPGHMSGTKTPLWKKRWVPYAALGITSLLIGVGIGGAGGSGKPKDGPAPVIETPAPAPTVTKTVEKRVEVPVTPESCLKALDLSEQGFSYAAEAMGYMSDALTAAGNMDVAALTKANSDIQVVSPKLKALTSPMRAASAECRAAAK